MKTRHYLLSFFVISTLVIQALATTPESKLTTAQWSMLTYIAADNSLASFASYNINDMAAGLASTTGVNVLVQWDQPQNKKTWRYQIKPGGKIDAGSLTVEMGYNPSKELVTSMQWVASKYPAKNYALILWDHGSGIEDFLPGAARSISNMTNNNASWLQLPGQTPQNSPAERGILYDDSQNTCLTNQGLTAALTSIKQTLGKNLDLIAMDACLMAMVEVAYQMKGLVNLFVGSEQTIPGNGYPYSSFIKPLSRNPATTSPLQLALSMVAAYQQFYTTQQPTSDFTLSAIDVTSIDLIKQNIDQFINAVAACSQIDPTATKKMIVTARKAAISFEMPEYIDLHSFYAGVLSQTKKSSPKSHIVLAQRQKKAQTNPAYQSALDTLSAVVNDGLSKISTVVLQSASGPVYAGAKGLSIYYPKSGAIDSTYPLTLFAKNTSWIKFIQQYR